jgi:hypothetical protein
MGFNEYVIELGALLIALGRRLLAPAPDRTRA